MRKTFLTIHRWLGIVFGILISLVCLTGAVLVFQTEILQMLNRGLYSLEVPADGKHLSDTELAALIGAVLPWSGYYMWWKRTRTIKKNA